MSFMEFWMKYFCDTCLDDEFQLCGKFSSEAFIVFVLGNDGEKLRGREWVRVIINCGLICLYSWLLAGPKVPVCSLNLLVTNPELFEPWKAHGGSTSPFIPGGACSGFPAEQERSPKGRKQRFLLFGAPYHAPRPIPGLLHMGFPQQ
jgi:hypothetical protein